jgi:hypothetical protein
MVDYKIILYILFHTTIEREASIHAKKECSGDKALIFFPFTGRSYYDKLNKLNSNQYLQRLKMLCPILGRNN